MKGSKVGMAQGVLRNKGYCDTFGEDLVGIEPTSSKRERLAAALRRFGSSLTRNFDALSVRPQIFAPCLHPTHEQVVNAK
jgi:hypothetical protein